MTKDNVLARIKKILAMAEKSTFEGEAENAMLKAQKIMAEHNITMQEVKLSSEEVNKKEVIEEKITPNEVLLWWVWDLGIVIAENFRCDCIKYSRGKKANLNFVGLREDVEIANTVFAFSKTSIEYFAKEYVIQLVNKNNKEYLFFRADSLKTQKDYIGEKNDYIKGFIIGIRDKFKEQVDKNNWGLVLVKDKAVTEFIENNLDIKKVTRQDNAKRSHSAKHFDNGYEDGKNMDYRNDLLT